MIRGVMLSAEQDVELRIRERAEGTRHDELKVGKPVQIPSTAKMRA
jgi:hypothetical protein